eukprot:Phypoly_transcript_21404.p1 GENE.Phypoly_transcript_21404~~Phypoly_transcript_21404.p1  ORF type:complete len:183 (+),score=15.97 Phypoly_transcript_21404:32-550(+)
MALVFKKVICVTWAIHNSKHSKVDKTGPLFWLLLRYLGTQLNQMTMWLPIMYWDLLNMLDIPPSPALVYFSAYAPGFTAINGFIVMAGNQPLRSSLYNFFGWARSRFSLISPIQGHKLPSISSDETQISVSVSASVSVSDSHSAILANTKQREKRESRENLRSSENLEVITN